MPDHTAKTKILYIDDDPIPRQLIAFVLEQHGFQIQTANDGREGVEMALDWLPNLILMDLMMPVMDGFQATKVLRTHPQTQQIPIVAFTAANETSVRTEAMAAGMNGVITKALTLPGLIKTLQSYLP